MKLKVTHDYLLIRECENPFIKKTTDSGLFIPEGFAQTQETGDIEKLDKIVGFAVVAAVGDECRWIKEGDGVYYDRRSIRPVPGEEVLFQFNERNIISYVEKEELHAQFAVFAEQEAKLEELQKQRYEKRAAEEEQRKAKLREDYDKAIANGTHKAAPFLIKIK